MTDPEIDEIQDDVVEPAATPEDTPPPPAEGEEPAPEPAPKPQTVPHGQFHKELTRRKEAEGRARKLEEENRRLYDTILQRLDGQREARAEALPPLDDDPANLRQHLQLHRQAIVELGQRHQEAAARDDSVAYLRAALAEARDEAPDVDPQELVEAGGYAFRAREAMYAAYLPPEQAFRAAQEDEQRFVAECRRQNKNPYLAARDIARRLGFGAQPKPPAVATPAPPKAAQRETGGLPRGGQRERAVDLSDPAQYDREFRRFFKERPNASKGDWYAHAEDLLKKQFA